MSILAQAAMIPHMNTLPEGGAGSQMISTDWVPSALRCLHTKSFICEMPEKALMLDFVQVNNAGVQQGNFADAPKCTAEILDATC